MSAPYQVVCLSAGMLTPKKSDLPLARQHLYLNYGPLGLASVLRSEGHEFMSPCNYFDLKAFSYLPRGTSWDPSDAAARNP